MKKFVAYVCGTGIGLILLAGCGTTGLATNAPDTARAGVKRTIHMSAVEYKGSAAVDKEPFPQQQPPTGGGYLLKPPEQGQWQTSSYRFEPGYIVVTQGDEVELNIWGVNGAHHHTEIEGFGKTFVVRRGQMTTISFKADRAGIFRIVCHDHQPSMTAQLVVLAK